MPPDSKFTQLSEMEREFHISRYNILALVNAGFVRCLRIGRLYYVNEADLYRYFGVSDEVTEKGGSQ